MSGTIQRRRGRVTRAATWRRIILLKCSLRKANALQSREERNRRPEKASKLIENVAGEPVSRILYLAFLRRPSDDHSSRPRFAPGLQQPTRGLLSLRPACRSKLRCEGVAHPPKRLRKLGEPGRLSPPIWPCTTRGFPCLVCCQTSGGLLPHRFTLTGKSAFGKTLGRFPCRPSQKLSSAGGLFSVALSVTPLPAPPGVTRRVALFPADAGRCPDFPPVPLTKPGLALVLHRGTSDHPAHPPTSLYVARPLFRQVLPHQVPPARFAASPNRPAARSDTEGLLESTRRRGIGMAN